MHNFRPRVLAAFLLTVLAAALVACGDGEEPRLPAEQVRIATGLEGGVYRPYGIALAKVVNTHLRPLHATALGTEGAVENIQRLNRREAEIAFTPADPAAPALLGKRPFTRPVKLAALARLYDDYMQVIVRHDSKLDGVRDLAGKTVSIGARRSGTALTAMRILRLPSLRLRGARAPTVRSLSLQASADALAAGTIDAFFWSGGLPTSTVADLRAKVPIRLLELPAGIAAQMDADLYTETQIPQYVYGGERAIRSVTSANLLVVREDMPEETAFQLTRVLFDHQPELERAHPEARRLNARAAIATYPVRLHPGAARWYRQQPP